MSANKKSATHPLSTKIIEEVSEENQSQSAASMMKEKKVGFEDQQPVIGKPPIKITQHPEDKDAKGQNPLLKVYQRIDQE